MSLLDKVSQVTDSHTSGRKIARVGNKSVVEKSNILDTIEEVEERKSDKVKISDSSEKVSVRYKVKTKVVIMDEDRVNAINNLPRVQRREEIKKMSDSERRKFLQVLKRIKDEQDNPQLWEAASLIFKSAQYGVANWEEVKTAFEEIEFSSEVINEYVDSRISGEDNKELFDKVITEFAEHSISIEGDSEIDDIDAELDEETLSSIESDGEELSDSIKNLDFNMLENVVDTYIAKYVNKGFNYFQVRDALMRGFNKKHISASDKAIMDSVVDEIAESIEEPAEDTTSAIEVLSKALEEFVNGNVEPLKELSETELQLESLEEPSESEVENEETENPSDESENLDEDIEDISLEDSVSYAKQILTGSMSHKLYDSLKNKLPILKKYLLRASDCVMSVAEPVNYDVIQAPLTQEEFQSLWKTPAFLYQLTQTESECPFVNEITPCNSHVCVNQNTVPQNWIPITGSVEDFMNNMPEETSEWGRYVKDNCVLVEDLLRCASRTNQLAVIDSKFYKTKLTDECWKYDSAPECLGSNVPCSGTVYPVYAEIPTEVPQVSILIFGQEYKVV